MPATTAEHLGLTLPRTADENPEPGRKSWRKKLKSILLPFSDEAEKARKEKAVFRQNALIAAEEVLDYFDSTEIRAACRLADQSVIDRINHFISQNAGLVFDEKIFWEELDARWPKQLKKEVKAALKIEFAQERAATATKIKGVLRKTAIVGTFAVAALTNLTGSTNTDLPTAEINSYRSLKNQIAIGSAYVGQTGMDVQDVAKIHHPVEKSAAEIKAEIFVGQTDKILFERMQAFESEVKKQQKEVDYLARIGQTKNAEFEYFSSKLEKSKTRHAQLKNLAESPLWPQIQQQILEMGEKYSVNPDLVFALIRTESDIDPDAYHPRVGATGAMQVTKIAVKDLQKSEGMQISWQEVRKNPIKNIEAGTAYLAKMLDYFAGDTELALAAYNNGIANVLRDRVLPETQQHVFKTLDYLAGGNGRFKESDLVKMRAKIVKKSAKFKKDFLAKIPAKFKPAAA